MGQYKMVKQAIKRKFPEIDRDDSLKTAINLMAQANVSVLAVKVQGELIGIVTVSDVMHGIANDCDLEQTKISTFMTECRIDGKSASGKLCIQLDEEQDAVSAIKVMYEGGINHLLVSGSGNKVCGIVSSLDLVKLLAAR
jgi:predicted transcriptional regulator